MHQHIIFPFQGFQTSIISNKKIIHEKLGINSVALGPYVIYMSAIFYPKLTSFTSYSVAPAQTYMLRCAKNLKTHFHGN